MLAPVSGSVNPPHLPRRRRGGQRMEHRDDRGRADSGTQEYDGSVARYQREAAAWRARVEHVAHLDLSVYVSPRHAMSFPFDAHAIALLARLARQRIAA